MIGSDTLNELLILFGSNIAVAGSSFFFTKKKYQAEVKGSDIQNFDASIEAFKKLYEEREQIYKDTIAELNKQISEVKSENVELRKQVMTISNFITAYMIQQGKTPMELSQIIKITEEGKQDTK